VGGPTSPFFAICWVCRTQLSSPLVSSRPASHSKDLSTRSFPQWLESGLLTPLKDKDNDPGYSDFPGETALYKTAPFSCAEGGAQISSVVSGDLAFCHSFYSLSGTPKAGRPISFLDACNGVPASGGGCLADRPRARVRALLHEWTACGPSLTSSPRAAHVGQNKSNSQPAVFSG
jgi:hypothetical protein